MKFKSFLYILGTVAVILTIFPFVAVDYWWIRIFDFPHIQLTILTFVAFVVFFMRFEVKRVNDYLFVTILAACLIMQAWKIIPYTPLAAKDIQDSQEKNAGTTISLYAANVLQSNKKPELLISDFKEMNPDIMLLVETNERWRDYVVKNLPDAYKYRVEVPQDNTYGMLLYSKYQLINPEVKYLVDKKIPSIHTKLLLTSGDTVQLYSIHPTPPMPQHNPRSTDRDSEMMKIANLSRTSTYPVIVLGDFNDVAWSNTTSLFQNVGELLDLRKGRGIYNTYNANSVVFRWPLDHIFVSAEFRLIAIKLGQDINSDHLPTYANLSFEPEKAAEQQPEKPSEKQLKNAKQQAERVQL
ncbi:MULTISPECIES: endonuclease/exonuclease/phosphatase family protein [Aequorivita]|uniref:Endonuclease/exonuclease/phosphatase family protein n=1 Tax=Aequorivita iocasae TaxID=2803865 RepID=A0ABX7DRW9_9FLAO|nr:MULTISPECIES: endonuclease/exonuclease/phosphatase family protein [Aequorivita]QQX76283.1 endonuclease/exonuclease/phosphatase family protein [Aequorivita iocasae]UCA55746.1 endonuclease/exonuclease/phosphatase family protein [Aequorivita sp. F7]